MNMTTKSPSIDQMFLIKNGLIAITRVRFSFFVANILWLVSVFVLVLCSLPHLTDYMLLQIHATLHLR